MTNIRLRDIEGYENFKAECEFFRCEDEYPGWTGVEKYGIITNMSEAELNEKYPALMVEMSPYLILKEELNGAISDYRKNEDKFAKRNINNNSIFELDEEAEAFHHELSTPDFLDELLAKENQKEMKHRTILLCNLILSNFSDVIQKRLVLNWVLKVPVTTIAEIDGCSHQAVSKSIRVAKEKILQNPQLWLHFVASNSMHYEEIISKVKLIISSISSKEEVM